MKFLDQVKIFIKAGKAAVVLQVLGEKNLWSLVALMEEMEAEEVL